MEKGQIDFHDDKKISWECYNVAWKGSGEHDSVPPKKSK